MVYRGLIASTVQAAEPVFCRFLGRMIVPLFVVVIPVLLLASAAGLLLLRRNRKRTRGLLAAALSLVLAAVLVAVGSVYATRIEPRRLQVREVTIRTDKVDAPVRMVHMSDIQSDSVGEYEREVFRRVRELEPDIVFHTGDLLQPVSPATFASELPKVKELLRSLDPPMGVFGVIGDTDSRFASRGIDSVGGMRLLSDEEAEVRSEGASIRILGLTLLRSRYGDVSGRVRSWLETGEQGDFSIVMGHAPDFIMKLTDVPVDLCLAGHTHGGQIRFPLIGPIVIFSKVPRAWARGYRGVGRTRLNVSAGVGCVHSCDLPSIRFNCPPEVTLIELRPE